MDVNELTHEGTLALVRISRCLSIIAIMHLRLGSGSILSRFFCAVAETRQSRMSAVVGFGTSLAVAIMFVR